jgi:hypothetical protein
MFITKNHLPRRTFLRGVGVSLALPLLDSMIPALTADTKTAANPVRRLGFVYIPHGMVMGRFTPVHEGAGFKITPILTPLAPFRDDLVVVSGLYHRQAESLGDGGADHARSPSTWLTGIHPKKTEGEDVRAGTTVDQIAAQRIGQNNPFPSLELATEDSTGLVGACDAGYSCTYINTISWRNPTTPNPMEINPRVVFDRLFGEGGTATERLERMQEDSSILDGVTQKLQRLQGKLGPGDRTRVSEYVENVREIERRIQLTEKQNSSRLTLPESPVGVPESYEEHVKLLFDLQALAYQADLTRVSTFMLARELSSRTYPQVGVSDPHHPVSHHQNDPIKLDKLVKIQTYHISLLAYFLQKLKSTQDGQGTLLDHTLLMYGSCMCNSNNHDHGPLPTLLAGGAAGRLQGGRHLKYPENTPMSNLLLTLLDKMDVRIDKVGDSTDRLSDV